MEYQNKEQLFVGLSAFANLISVPLYWLDLDGVVLGANDVAFTLVGGMEIKEKIIGKRHHDFYPQEVSVSLDANTNQVIRAKQALEFVEQIVDMENGIAKSLVSLRSPLWVNDKMVGVIGTSIDITERKHLDNSNLERLSLENQGYKVKMQENQKVLRFIEDMQHSFRSLRVDMLNDRLGIEFKLPKLELPIKLTKREREVLYFLSLHKSPKEIAGILSIIENKPLSPSTVLSVVDKQLYPKFNVNNVSKLVEVANRLKLIPFSIP